jgi:hypothetical protein
MTESGWRNDSKPARMGHSSASEKLTNKLTRMKPSQAFWRISFAVNSRNAEPEQHPRRGVDPVSALYGNTVM